MKRRIGIDAKWYFEGPASGKMVVRNLVNELIQVENNNFEFYFILDKKHKKALLDFEKFGLNKVYVWNGNNLISNVVLLPWLANKYNLDVILYQTSVSFMGGHKKIAYIHDLIFLTHPQFYTFIERLYFSPIRFLTKYADFIITVSEFERKRFKELKFSDRSIKVLHHGFDPIFNFDGDRSKVIESKLMLRFGIDSEYILYVGRINVRKNVSTLIKAFLKLNQSKLKLVIVGNKEWKIDPMEDLIHSSDDNKRIIVTGPLFGEELAEIYANAKLFCFPSFEESFGLPPLEAMASGVPVVVSNSSSIPEVCGEAGIYFNPFEVDDLVDKLQYVLQSADVRNHYSLLSKNQSKLFSWKNSVRKLIHILDERYGS
jgi:glycosyltransferase involved in cell wall biosynthesis